MRVLSAIFLRILILISVFIVIPPAAYSSELTLLNPTFIRGKGAPAKDTLSFSVPAPAESYRIEIINGNPDGTSRCSSALVDFNGITIVEPSQLNQQVSILYRSVSLNPTNLLSVTMNSAPGSFLTLRIIGIDNTSPHITIASPEEGEILGSPVNAVSGSTDDPYATITVNGGPATNSGSSYQGQVILSYGSNTITAEAKDFYGNTARASVNVIMDNLLPVITLDPTPEYTSNRTIEIKGRVEDLTALTVSIQGKSLSLPSGGGPFSFIDELTEGPNNLTVTAKDSALNISEAARSVVLDTIAPSVKIAFPLTDTYTNLKTTPVSGTVSDATATKVVVNGIDAAVSGSGFNVSSISLTEGQNRIRATATDSAGNTGSDEITISSDTVSPEIFLDPTPEFTSSRTLELKGTVQDMTSTTISIQGKSMSVPAGGGSYSLMVDLVEGLNTLILKAQDSAGNISEETRTITLDTIPPVIKITSPASGSYLNKGTTSVSGTINDATATKVTVNGIEAVVSQGSFTLESVSLIEGSNTIRAVATDAASNTGSDEITVTSDTIAPVVTITSPSAGTFINKNTTPVSGTISDATASKVTVNGIEAAVTQGAFTVNSVPLSEGNNILKATATDSAGNTGSDEITVISDTNAPVITIDPLPEYTKTGTIEIKGTISDLTATTVTLQGQTVSLPAGGGPFSFTISLSEGSNTLTVTAIDSAGNTSDASGSVTLDSIPPVVKITAPSAGAFIKGNITDVLGNVDDATSTGVDVNGLPASVTGRNFEVRSAPLSEGSNTITAVATDSAGNTGRDEIQVISDTMPPVITIDPLPQYIAQSSIEIKGRVDDLTATTLTSQGQTVAIPAGGGPFSLTLSLTEGQNTLTFSAGDSAGNTSQVTRSIISDTILPAVTITSPASGSYISRNSTEVSGTASDASAITLTINGIETALNQGIFMTTVFLSEGQNFIRASARDAAGNVGTAEIIVFSDTIPPVVIIGTPSNGLKTNVGSQFVSGGITDASPIASAALNGTGITLTSGRFGQQYNLSEGINTLIVSAVDAAGNEGSASVIAILDSIPPDQPVIDPLPPITNLRNITVTGYSEPNSLVKIVGFGETNADSSGRFSIVLTLNPDSLNSFSARVYDELNNESLPSDFSILQDSTSPSVLSHSVMADPKITLLIPVSVTFSEAIDPETVNVSNIAVIGPSGAVAGALSMSGHVVTFTPSADLPVNKTFTINVGAGIKDRVGNSLSPVYTASFDTTRGGPSIVLGEVYDDTVGLPIEGAEARIVKTGGEIPDPIPTAWSDAMGRFSLKYEGIGGVAVIEIGKAGYTKVIRYVLLQPNKSVTLFDARLTPVKTQTISATSGGTVAEGDTSLSIPPGGFNQATTVSLAVVSPQGIGFRLPIGWSPVIGVDASPRGVTLNSPATLSIKNTWAFTPLQLSGGVAVAFFDAHASAWVSGSAGLSGDYIVVNVPKLGQYLLIVPDTLPAFPQMPSNPGEPILSSMDNPPSTGAASVKVVPPAVLSKQGAKGNTTVIVTTPSPIPSGTTIEAKISERYDLKNGETVMTEPFIQDITLYAYPEDGDANTISAGFPATPSKYYPLGTLYYGKVNIDIHLPSARTGGDMIGAGGGTITGPGSTGMIIPPSSLTEGSAITLSSLSEAELPVSSPSNLTLAGAFVLQMEGGSFSAGMFPQFILSGLTAPDGTRVIVSRVESIGGKDELKAVAIATVLSGNIVIERCLTSPQPPTPGACIYSGRYAFYIPSRPFGFISGNVLKAEVPASGIVLAVDNLPFKVASDSSGGFTMLSLSGAYTITATEALTGQSASASGTIAGDETQTVRLDLAPVSLKVIDITPYDKQTGAASDSKVKVTFSKAVEPLTVTSSTFTVFEQPKLSTQSLIPVPGRISMTSQNTMAVFTPDAGLKPDTAYQVKLTEGIQDTFGVTLTPFHSTFTTSEVLSNEVLPPGKLKASMPDADGYVTVRGGVGLTYGGATVLIINKTKNIVLTVIANEDGSFEGRIRADISDEIVVQVKDLLGNITTLSTGLMQNPDGTAAVGPRGGTIYGPGGIVAAIPEGAFDETIAVQITMVSEEVVKDVVMHPELVSGGVFKLDSGGVTAKKEIKVTVPAPEWITPGHQVLLTKVDNVRGYDELTLSCPAVLKDGKLVTTSPPFEGVYQNGLYRFVSWADPAKGVAFVEASVWVTRDHYAQSYVTGEYHLVGSVPFQKKKMMVVTLPVNRPYDVDLMTIMGEKLCSVSVQGPPVRGEFYPQVINLTYDNVPPAVIANPISDGSTDINPGIDSLTVTLSEQADPSTVNNTTVIVKDSKGNIVEGTVYLAADGVTIVFIPKYGYKYGETYTMYINGVKDLGGNSLAPYRSSFTTFKPEVLATVPVPMAIGIAGYKNFVAVSSWDYEGVCSTPNSRITIIDVADPAQPQKRGETRLWQTVLDVKALPDMSLTGHSGYDFSGDMVVATGFRQFCTSKSKTGLIELVNAGDPGNPRELLVNTGGLYLSWNPAYSSAPPPDVPYQFGEPVESALIGTNAYVANSGLGVQAVDLTQVTPPEDVAQASAIGGTFTANTNTNPDVSSLDLFPSISQAGLKVLALKYNRLIILSPQLTVMGELPGLNHAYSVTGVGAFPIDIDNDGNIGTFEDNDGDPTTSAQETFDLALISAQDGIVIADVSTAGSPKVIDMIPGEGGKLVVDRARRIAYNGGLSIFSLKNLRPDPPANLGAKIDTDGDGVDDRVLLRMPEASGRNVLSDDGNLLYAADYSNGLVKIVYVGELSPNVFDPCADSAASAGFDGY